MSKRKLLAIILIPAILLTTGGLAMAHGSPDYGPLQPKTTTYSSQDMAELAVRLGSIVSFDRRGDVVWMDDFEDNINRWYLTGLGTGSDIALSTTRAHQGAKSAALTPGNAVDDWACISKSTGAVIPSKIGFSIATTITDEIDHYIIEIEYYDGTKDHIAKLRYDRINKTLAYFSSAETYTTFAEGIKLKEYPALFYNLKLVIDVNSREYVRVLTDTVEYDLSGIGYTTYNSTDPPLLTVSYKVVNNDTGNFTVYADNAIITQNEP
jgi:hypothetical protein